MVENKQQCFIKPRKKERNKEVKKKIERINYWQEIFRICYKVIFYEKKKKNTTELKKMKTKYKF